MCPCFWFKAMVIVPLYQVSAQHPLPPLSMVHPCPWRTCSQTRLNDCPMLLLPLALCPSWSLCLGQESFLALLIPVNQAFLPCLRQKGEIYPPTENIPPASKSSFLDPKVTPYLVHAWYSPVISASTISCSTLSPKSHHRWAILDIKGYCLFQDWWKRWLMLDKEPANQRSNRCPQDQRYETSGWASLITSSFAPHRCSLEVCWSYSGVDACTQVQSTGYCYYLETSTPQNPYLVMQHGLHPLISYCSIGLTKEFSAKGLAKASHNRLHRKFKSMYLLYQCDILWIFDFSLSCVYAEFPFMWVPIALSNSSLCCSATTSLHSIFSRTSSRAQPTPYLSWILNN